MKKFRKMADKGIAYLKRNGIRGFAKRMTRKALLSRPVHYGRWLKKHSASPQELKWQRENIPKDFAKIGVIILGTEGSAAYRETLQSLEEQSYRGFEICSACSQPTCGYLLLLEEGTVAQPEALYVFAEEIQKHPQGMLFYSDHDERKAGGGGSENPCCKPEFDLYYLQSKNYIGTAFLVSEGLVQKAGMPDESKQGAVFYDYLLRCAEKTESVIRIPRILFHEPQKSVDTGLEKRALMEHYRRLQVPVRALTEEKRGIYAAQYRYEDGALVSVIIPNKDNEEQLKACVESVLKEGGYENLEILIVENNSEKESTFACYQALERADSRVRVITWQGAFQYSKINNDAARQARGDYLLFLNNDTKVKQSRFLAELMNIGRRPDVGAVGARLSYGDGSIQHGGVILGYGGIAGHAFEGMSGEQYEKLPFVPALRQAAAVTAACMLAKRKAFEMAGGFCEELKVAYNDVDLCLSMREKGWKVLYCPQAQMYHYESQTRGLEMTKEKAQRVLAEQKIFQKRWQKQLEKGDPYYNPNLTLECANFSLKR